MQKKLPTINSAHGSETRNIINELIKLFNGMGYTYEEALNKAHDVLNEAKKTNDMNVNVQTQINNIMDDLREEGITVPEVSQAKVDNEGYVYDTLKDRLDVQDERTNQAKIDLFEQRNNLETYTPIGNISPKALYKVGGHVFVVTQKPNGNGYIRFRLRDDITTTTQSVGGAAELLRVVEVLNVRTAFTRQFENSGSSGSGDFYDSSLAYQGTQLEIKTTSSTARNVVGTYIEYDVDIPNGIAFVQTLISASSGSSDNVEISIDGKTVDNVSFKGNGWKRITTFITPGSHKLRFTLVNTGYMSIAGVNVTELNNFKNGLNYDRLFDDVQFTNNRYVVNNGSMDYAMVDADSGLYCGSYHGGETRSRLRYLIENNVVTLNNNDLHVGNVIEVEQDTKIVGKLNAYSRQVFKLDGSREFDVVFEGNINLTLLFTNMTTALNEFTEIIYPEKLSVTTDGNYYLSRGANYVIQRNPSTNQKITTILNSKILPIGELGRTPYVKGAAASLYNKLYKANIDSEEPVNFTGGGFRTIHIFE